MSDPPATCDPGGVRHWSRPDCPGCRVGHPVACVCGGWLHAGESLFGPTAVCDGCGESGRPATPLLVGGDPHAPGRPDCPACPGGHPRACVCGGLIHAPADDEPPGGGGRRCDRCGGRYQEIDL